MIRRLLASLAALTLILGLGAAPARADSFVPIASTAEIQTAMANAPAEADLIILRPGQGIDLATGQYREVSAAMMNHCYWPRICFYDYWCTCSVNWWPLSTSTAGTACWNIGTDMRNKTSYIWNNSDAAWYVWTGLSCSGTRGSIWPRSDGNMSSPYNNSLDSVRFRYFG